MLIGFKMVIILDEALPAGLQCNTAAVLALSLGQKVEGLIGKDLKDKSGVLHKGLTQLPIPILKTSSEKLRDTYNKALDSKDNLFMVDVTDAAQTTVNYSDYEDKLTSRATTELNLLGIALTGSQKEVVKLTGNFPLLR